MAIMHSIQNELTSLEYWSKIYQYYLETAGTESPTSLELKVSLIGNGRKW